MGLRATHRRQGVFRPRHDSRQLPQELRGSKGVHLRPGDSGPAHCAVDRHLPELWVAWIDNSAGEAVLRKGYGKDVAVNGVLAAFWALASKMQWSPEFNRVKSESNIADAVSRGDLSTAKAQGWDANPRTSSQFSPTAPTTSTTPTTGRPRTSSLRRTSSLFEKTLSGGWGAPCGLQNANPRRRLLLRGEDPSPARIALQSS